VPADPSELLRQLAGSVAEVEAGRCPAGYSDRTSALAGLVAELCGAPWKTAEERSQAQGLVARLERLRWAES
jgi:hypothetical protein